MFYGKSIYQPYGREFKPPPSWPLTKQVILCVDIINKQRDELLPLRQRIGVSERFGDYWKEKALEYEKKYEEEKKKNKQLERDKSELQEIVDRITKTNTRYRSSLFHHGNFATPQEREQNKKDHGGQHGHADTNREKDTATKSWHRKRIFATNCGHCGHPLERVHSFKEKILIDIVLNPQVVQLVLESERQWCGNCKKEVTAKDPQTLPFTEWGLNIFMLVLLLRFRCHLAFSAIVLVLKIGHGLKISHSGVKNLLDQAKGYLGKRYDELMQAVRDSDISYNDETGWLIKGKRAHMWIMANDTTTIYVAAATRGKGIFETMRDQSDSFAMHDGYSVYENTIPPEKQMYCWAHFLGFVYTETEGSERDSISRKIRNEIIALYRLKKDPLYQEENLLKQALDIRLSAILGLTSDESAAKAIQERLRTQKIGLINALLYTKDGTNNQAERELRGLTQSRAISYGSYSLENMETTAMLASIVQTELRKDPAQFFDSLTTYFTHGIQKKFPQYHHQAFFDSS